MIDLAGQWKTLWGPLESTGLVGILSFVAFVVALIAVIKYFVAKQQGRGGDNKGLIWTAVVCVILAAPGTILPSVLRLVDWVLNFVLRLGSNVVNGA